MKANIHFFALLTLLATLTGCKTAQNLQIENPNYVIRNLRPRVSVAIPLSQSSIDVDMVIEVQNQNGVALRLDRVVFDLFINDNRVAAGTTNSQIRIPAQGSGEFPLRTRIGYNEIRTLFREVVDMVQGERARYEVRGRAFYKTPMGELEFPMAIRSSRRD